MFIAPLLRLLEVQRTMSHTQLFVSFIDAQRLKEAKREEAGAFLSAWCCFRWRYRNASKFGLNMLREALGRGQSRSFHSN